MYQELVDQYLTLFDKEKQSLAPLLAHLAVETDAQMIDRKNFRGHFTASCFLLSEVDKRVLLLRHAFLGLDIQPGGHVESQDQGPFGAATRELFEETGLSVDKLLYHKLLSNSQVPFNIAIHRMPANPIKQEAAHFHYDFQYLFTTDHAQELKLDEQESLAASWVPWTDFCQLESYQEIANKIDLLIKGK